MDISAFFTLIVSGETDAVRQALANSPWLTDVRCPRDEDWDERWPLHCAAKYGHLEIVKLLVEKGAEVYSNPMATYPPVIIACWNKRRRRTAPCSTTAPTRWSATRRSCSSASRACPTAAGRW